jgi:hypothetical protein
MDDDTSEQKKALSENSYRAAVMSSRLSHGIAKRGAPISAALTKYGGENNNHCTLRF